MRRIDFSKLKPNSVGQTAAIDRIARWVENHPSADFIDPEELSYAHQDVGVGDLASVLQALVDLHELEMRFKVKSPYDQSLADQFFSEPYVDVEVYDQSERRFNALDGEFIPVFVELDETAHG